MSVVLLTVKKLMPLKSMIITIVYKQITWIIPLLMIAEILLKHLGDKLISRRINNIAEGCT